MLQDKGQSPLHRILYFLNGLAILLCFSGLFIPLMDPDAGVYASISKTMALNNDYVNLYFQETDWLDKPHFPFWITAVFFKVFGYHDWVYKLPGILFVLLGAFYTYRFALKYYNKTISLWSVFILLTAMHIIISNNDVRAEPFLTGLIIASIYHFSNTLKGKWGWQMVWACFFAGLAVMTKGIFTLIPIGAAVAGQLILQQEWKQIFHWKWIFALLLVILFISPELYCLWKQFDTHPEKAVLGSQQVSGIRFFLWDSQFGRFFNTGPIKGKGDKLFFLHTLLWAFLPWSLIMYAALYSRIRQGIKKIQSPFTEWFTLCSSLLTLLVFSFSGFQLPHYTNIIFPMLAILTAVLIDQQVSVGQTVFAKIQNGLVILILVLVGGLLFFYRPALSFIFIIAALLLLLSLLLLPKFSTVSKQWYPYLRSGLAVLFVAVFLNLCFYPDLLRYQSGNQAAAYMNKQFPDESLGRLGIYFPSGEFYLHQPTYRSSVEDIRLKKFSKTRILFVNAEELEQLEKAGVALEKIKSFEEFHVTMLSLKFINPKTRHKELKQHYLIRLL